MTDLIYGAVAMALLAGLPIAAGAIRSRFGRKATVQHNNVSRR